MYQEELEQILVSLDGDTYRVGLLTQTPDEEGFLTGIRYHDYLGRIEPEPEEITFRESQIVSYRTIRLYPSEVIIYHYSSNGKIHASEYAVAGQDQLTPITNHGFGSGIYGLNIPQQEVASKKQYPNQSVFQINCQRIFLIQDEEHGNSISQASKITDRYVDYVVSYIKQQYPNQHWSLVRSQEPPICDEHGASGQLSQIIQLMDTAELSITPDMEVSTISGLQLLWNNVFAREYHQIMVDLNILRMIIGTYILLYLTNLGRLIPTPITYLMVTFRFDSLISTDPYDNSFSRGCVRYCPFPDIPKELLEYTTRKTRLFLS